ncbi:MAG: type II toxin-antitoxin system HicA family toxin [Ignavibacteriales bacterium]|nr:type II toxin-antitoxin system HicA family toxin [Ignavibacteriales bacterium]
MKRKELLVQIAQSGWWFLRQGGNHEMWTNGEHCVPVPRHKEISEFTARGILKKVKQNPAKRR